MVFKPALSPFRRYAHIRLEIILTLEVWPRWTWEAPIWCAHSRSYIDEWILDAVCKPFSMLAKITGPVVEVTLHHSSRIPGLNELGRHIRARRCIVDALEEKLRSLPRVREYHVRVDVLENFTRHGRKAGLVLRAHTCASSDRTKTEHDPTESLENIQTADSMGEDENVEERLLKERHTSDSLVQRFMQKMDIEQGQKLDWDSDDEDDYDKVVVPNFTKEDREAFYQDHGESDGEEEIDSDESDTDSDDDEVTEAEEMPERFEWAAGHVELDYWE